MHKIALSLLAALINPVLALAGADDRDAETFFELKIRPVLADTCFKCHGGKKTSNGLRVDSREALLKGGDSGPALVPGKPDKSLMIQAIRHTGDELKMPPDKKLPEAVVAEFTKWVNDGAIWPKKTASSFRSQKHWAFEPVKKPTPPVDPTGWASHPVDQFIAAKLRERGLKPTGPADKRVLLRRVYFDLIGLPPTPKEMADFLADQSPDAYAKVVDRLLASPQYGERWGRHWMDVARYADTAGDNADYPIPEVRLYRDYIVDSFNADKPYDEFVREQIAGDILAKQGPKEKYAERVVATGFLSLSRHYGTAPYELWHLTLEDAIETTGRAFLGLTLRCARCHDHKFDPVTKEDYYALYGIFESTQFPWAGGEEFNSLKKPREHFAPLNPPAETASKMAAFRQRIEQLEADIRRTEKEDPLAKRVPDLQRQIDAKNREIQELAKKKQKTDALKTELTKLTRERDLANGQLQVKLAKLRDELFKYRRASLPSDLPGAYAVGDGKSVDAYVQVRGDVAQRGPVVKRGVPKFLDGGKPIQISPSGSGRLQLGEWLTRPDNPLTARVMVNRIWQHHFGKGIVGTPSNFGFRGEPPTHPELLDWLATEFMASGGRQTPGWSIKRMHRLILSSKTYQLASSHDAGNAAKDPGNQWYWRSDRRRLDAEAIRDAMMFVSGKLDLTRPGPQPFPPIDQWHWTQHIPFKETYATNHRSVYLMTQRWQRHPYLALFDGPDTNTTTDQRTSATVPQQALFLTNSPFAQEQAEAFARRLIAASPDRQKRIALAHELAWSRPAKMEDLERGVQYVDTYQAELTKAGGTSGRIEVEAWTSYARVMLSANEFVYLD